MDQSMWLKKPDKWFNIEESSIVLTYYLQLDVNCNQCLDKVLTLHLCNSHQSDQTLLCSHYRKHGHLGHLWSCSICNRFPPQPLRMDDPRDKILEWQFDTNDKLTTWISSYLFRYVFSLDLEGQDSLLSSSHGAEQTGKALSLHPITFKEELVCGDFGTNFVQWVPSFSMTRLYREAL